MTELVPLPDASTADLMADPAAYVVEACERAKAWLANALEHGDIEQIVELRSQAEAIRVYTRQKELGKDAELSAAEIVRRAERGIGIAVRRGQEEGELLRHGETFRRPSHVGRDATNMEKRSPKEFFGSNQEAHETYAVTDGVSDDEFDSAVETAKAEGNLSRANVVRKVRDSKARQDPDWIPEKGDTTQEAALRRRQVIREMASEGYSSVQIGERIHMRDDSVREAARKSDITITADEVMGVAARTRTKVDSNRIVRETVSQLDGLDMAVGLVVYEELDRSEIHDWTTSLTESIRVLNRLNKKLKEMVQ